MKGVFKTWQRSTQQNTYLANSTVYFINQHSVAFKKKKKSFIKDTD